jgi:hypothetical protein
MCACMCVCVCHHTDPIHRLGDTVLKFGSCNVRNESYMVIEQRSMVLTALLNTAVWYRNVTECCTVLIIKRPIHSQLNWAILLCDVIPDGKNGVNCAVLTENNAGLRTVLSGRLSHTELRSSLGKSHSFLSLPADTTMASTQGIQPSSNSFSRWASHDIFLSNTTSYSTFYAFFSTFRITLWPIWLANSKRQPCFYPP